MKIPTTLIEIQNRWGAFEREKGRRPKINMLEGYYDVYYTVPSINQ